MNQAWAYLGLYFAKKLRGGVDIYTYQVSKNVQSKNMAINHIQKVATDWKESVHITEYLYCEIPLVHLKVSKYEFRIKRN